MKMTSTANDSATTYNYSAASNLVYTNVPDTQTTSDCAPLRRPQARGNPDGFSDGSGVSGRGTAAWITTSRSPGNDDDLLVFSKLLTAE
jgi:hypothetical protein